MFTLDMRTALFSYMLVSLISTLLSALILKQISNRYKGVYHLFFCFLLQALTLLLILLRGVIPDWISFDLSNSLSIGGIILFLTGIEEYTDQKSTMKPNLLLLLVFIIVHTWFTFFKPDLSFRHLNVSLAWLLLFVQAVWLLLFRIPVSGAKRILPMTVVCILFCIVCIVRIMKFFFFGHSEDYFHSDLFDIIIIIISQLLLILLIFSLAYMFGGRLFDDIRAEEEKFSKIFQTAPFPIILSRLNDGMILEVNKIFLQKTGFLINEISGKTTVELGLWMKELDRMAIISEIIACGKVTGKEIIIKKKDGNPIFGHLTSEILIVNGELCIFSCIDDITDRKRIQREKDELFRSLAESEEKCRSFFINSLDANFLTAPDGSIFSANPAACSMLGYTEQEICSLGSDGIMDIGDLRLSEALTERDVTGKFAGELTMVRKDGEKFPVELSSVIFSNGEGQKMTSMIARDITERKLAEQKLREASFYTRNLIEASLDPFMTINIDGKITDVNRSAEELTGKERGQLIGSNFMDHFTEPKKAKAGYMTVFREGLVRDYPLTIIRSGSNKCHVLFNATLFRDDAGEVKGIFAVARDITERLKTEEDLRKSKELLEKLNRHLVDVRENERKIIAMALHDDLGQRLTGLYLDIAWLKNKLTDQPVNISRKLDQITCTITETVETVKETSAMLRPVILFELGLVPAIKTQLKRFEKQSEIKCRFNYDQSLAEIDQRVSIVLYRIFQESMTNIMRHSRATIAEVNLSSDDSSLQMLIRDNGLGISEAMINSPESMGIAGMRERIRSVNGTIVISSKDKSGTIVSVIIPQIQN